MAITERANTGGTTEVEITEADRKRHTKEGHKPAEEFGTALGAWTQKKKQDRVKFNQIWGYGYVVIGFALILGGIYSSENYWLYGASVVMFALAAYRLLWLDKKIRN